MTTKLRTASAAMLLLILSSIPAAAQTVDEIIEKHLAATGGRSALGKLTSRIATGTVTLTTPAGNVSGPVELYTKAPNKARTVIRLDLSALGGGRMTWDQRFDGTSGYVMDSINGNREITGSQLDAMRNNTFPTPLLNYREIGFRAESAGREQAGGADAYVIRLTPKAGPAVRVFIDAATFMLVKTTVTVAVPELGTEVEQVIEFSDYREVDGVKVPYTTRSSNPVQTVVATLQDVDHNTPIEDSAFSRPAGR